MSEIVKMIQVFKSYSVEDGEIPVLKGIDFHLNAGEKVCIVGTSGSGKSTFLHLLGGLDDVSSGEILYKHHAWKNLNDEQKSKIRNEEISFIFQLHHVIREFDVINNVMLPLRIRGMSYRKAYKIAEYYLNQVGLFHRIKHYPSQLSGGELQRVSIARAIVIEPQLLLADEPTGSLDSKTSKEIQDLLFKLHEQLKMSLVIVTHDLGFSGRFEKVLRISDGRWVEN